MLQPSDGMQTLRQCGIRVGDGRHGVKIGLDNLLRSHTEEAFDAGDFQIGVETKKRCWRAGRSLMDACLAELLT